jgi:hypothetical protein
MARVPGIDTRRFDITPTFTLNSRSMLKIADPRTLLKCVHI